MMWTNHPPDREGYYWYCDDHICDIVRVQRGSDHLLYGTGTALLEHNELTSLDGQWSGPITLPAGDQSTRLPFSDGPVRCHRMLHTP